MVKQIRSEEIVGKLIDRGDGYFHWLQKKSGLSGPLSSMLADTEFVSVNGLDDILEKKAKEEVREKYAEDVCEDSKSRDILCKSIRGNCCLFEVVLCLAFSINEMFEDTSAFDGPSHFFGIMMENARFSLYDEEDWDMRPDEVKKYWEKCIKRILERTYSSAGGMGLFPLDGNVAESYEDRTKISLWQQMNDWVDQHTDEDGEWVD